MRRYVHAVQTSGQARTGGGAQLTNELLTRLLASLRPPPGRPRGEEWESCQAHRELIAQLRKQGLRLSKLRKHQPKLPCSGFHELTA